MSSLGVPVLQQLHRLDRSSSGFQDRLGKIIDGEEFKQCVLSLQDGDLVRLVDYLDKVRQHIVLPHFPLKSAQALDALNPSTPVFRKCLHELRTVCGTREILPTSYVLSGTLRSVGSLLFTPGGSNDVYEGILDDSRVSIKRVRMYSKGGPGAATKVHYWSR